MILGGSGGCTTRQFHLEVRGLGNRNERREGKPTVSDTVGFWLPLDASNVFFFWLRPKFWIFPGFWILEPYVAILLVQILDFGSWILVWGRFRGHFLDAT